MIFELKNVKHFEAMSNETHCFQATLYANGKRCMLVSNAGRGGPMDVDTHIKGENNTDFRARILPIFDHVATLPDTVSRDCEFPPTLETIVCDLLESFLELRQFKGMLKRNWMFVRVDKTTALCTKRKGQTHEHFAKYLTAKQPGAQSLNLKPIEEALAIWNRAQSE